MQRSRGFRGNNYNRGRNNYERKPWISNFNNGQSNAGAGNVSPFACNTSPFGANNTYNGGNIPPLLSPNNHNNVNHGMVNVPQWGNQNVLNNRSDNYSGQDHKNTNWSGVNFTPPESDGSYWRQCPNPYSNHKYRTWQQNNQGFDGNYRKQFDRRTPYERPQRGRNRPNRSRSEPYQESRECEETTVDVQPELTPHEARVEKLMNAVKSQPHGIGDLVLMQNNNEIPPVLLHNAAHQVKNCVLAIDRDENNGYTKLKINGFSIAEGMYSSKKDAKEALYEMGLEILRGKCFYITSKSHFEEVSMDALAKQKEEEQSPAINLEGSKAHQMMLKMGWGGKGLGTKEQGEQKSVAEKIVENITREGLGTQNVMQEVDRILAEYARSPKTTTLAFDSGFTKEERAHIHAIAAKYHLKSKSEGGFNLRRITISKKMSKWMLVRELLMVGGENESYVLTIPEEFEELWTELCKENAEET